VASSDSDDVLPAAAMHMVHNARVQLLATALNNLGVGAIAAGVLAPTISGTAAAPGHIVAWLVFGADLIAMAQFWLGRLR